jgi:hypothetical protein
MAAAVVANHFAYHPAVDNSTAEQPVVIAVVASIRAGDVTACQMLTRSAQTELAHRLRDAGVTGDAASVNACPTMLTNATPAQRAAAIAPFAGIGTDSSLGGVVGEGYDHRNGGTWYTMRPDGRYAIMTFTHDTSYGWRVDAMRVASNCAVCARP